jgi:hypothetical protein
MNATSPAERLEALNAELAHHVERLEYHYDRQKKFEGGIRYHREKAKTLMRYRNEIMEEIKQEQNQ